MTISNIIDLIGNLTWIGILITVLINILENKKTRYTNIITKQTLDNNRFLRENYSTLATLSKPAVIDELRNDASYKYKYTIIHAVDNMETQLKYCFPYEQKMMSQARNLCKLCIQYYDRPSSELGEKIQLEEKKLFELIAPYDYADWLYIKSQAKGRPYMKSPVSFNKILEEEKPKFKTSQKPLKW